MREGRQIGLTGAGSKIFLRGFVFLENQTCIVNGKKDSMLREINESMWNILRNDPTGKCRQWRQKNKTKPDWQEVRLYKQKEWPFNDSYSALY